MRQSDEATLHRLAPEARSELLSRVRPVFASFPAVRVAFAIGSFARGESFRDLDIAVVLESGSSWRLPAQIARAVREALGNPDYEIDVVVMNDATPAFRWEASKQGTLLFERDAGDATDEWVTASSARLDYLEWRRIHGLEA